MNVISPTFRGCRNPYPIAALMLWLALLLVSPYSHSQNHIISVQFHWYHQFEYAGYYAALEKGFYAEEGLEVQLVSGGPGSSSVQRVSNNEVQFGVASSELLLAYLRGEPVVAVAPIFQHSAAVFLTRADSDIRTIDDFVGKRVEMGSLNTDAESHAMLHARGINLGQIDLIPSTFNPQGLIEGNSDVVSAYLTNQPYYMLRQGVPYRIIRPQDYGIDFYGDTLFISQQVATQQPETVDAFQRATIRGWEYAFQHSDELIDLILTKYNSKPITHTREHLEYERDQMLKLVMPGLVSIGHSNPARWQSMADTFSALGLVKSGLP
ncbi:MAG: ABC transporter substrate-binding protein, partial [Motiliproteus sp.]|nr:ABC transporter substrate-binding protein [Motiliproteus sp.]